MTRSSITVHEAPLDVFAELREHDRGSADRLTSRLSTDDGKERTYRGSLVEVYLERLALGLALGDEDDRLPSYAATAAEHAEQWTRLSTAAGGPGSLGIDPRTYETLLDTLAAFSRGARLPDVAAVPEETYQTWGVFHLAYGSALLRARRAWILGDEATARSLALEVADLKAAPWAYGAARAVGAMIDRDEAAFRDAVDAMVRGWRTAAGRDPRNPRMFVCLTGLAICRMALSYGYRVDDRLYLPTRLLPTVPLR